MKRPLPTLRGLHFLAVCILLVPNHPPQAQPLAPDRLPENWEFLVEVPPGARAWKDLQNHPLRHLLIGPPGSSTDIENLYGDLGALVDDGCGQYARIPQPGSAASPVHLFLVQTADTSKAKALRDQVEKLLIHSGASRANAVTRLQERIGAARVHVVTDGQSEAATLLSPDHGVAGFSNNADVLRDLARRLQGARDDDRETDAAWPSVENLFAAESRPAHLRFFRPPRGAAALAGAPPSDPLSNLVQRAGPGGALVGGIRFEKHSLVFDAFANFAPDDTSLASRIRQNTSPTPTLAGAAFIAPEPVWATAGRFSVDAIRHYLLAAVESTRASFPEDNPAHLAPASSATRARLESLGAWLAETDALDPLGPDGFIALNRLEFQEGAPLPILDFSAGILTRSPDETRAALLRLEQVLTEGAKDSAPPATGSLFTDASLSVSGQPPIVARALAAPNLDARLRPAWAITDGWLLVASSVEALSRAIGRRNAADRESLAPVLDATRERLGLDAIHAVQCARPAPAADHLAALASAWMLRRQKLAGAPPLPGSTDPAGAVRSQIAETLRSVERIAVVQKTTDEGVHTAGEVVFAAPPPLPSTGADSGFDSDATGR